MPRTFLVDGSALAYRSYYAKGPGPAYAWASTLISLVEREQPDYALVAFDTRRPTFRHAAYPAYKATRQKTPEDLVAQLPLFERIAGALGFRVFALEGWEADDVLGTLALRAADAGHEVFLVTGDKDFMQILGERICIYNLTQPGAEPVVMGVDAVRAKFHCRPDQVVDVLALMGDSSDNIPGVQGIGEKTALKLIEQYAGLDDIYAHVDEIKPPSLASRLKEGREAGYLSRELATIRTDAPVPLQLDQLRYAGPAEAAGALFVELDFPSLAKRLAGARADKEPAAARADLAVVLDRDGLAAFEQALAAFAAASGARPLALSVVATGPVALEAEIVGVALAWEGGPAFYLPANLTTPLVGPGDRGRTARERSAGSAPDEGMFARITSTTSGRGLPGDPLRPPPGSDLAHLLALLSPVLADPEVGLCGHDLKHDLHVLGRYGLSAARLQFDTMLASYCLDAHQSQHGLDFLALKNLGQQRTPPPELSGPPSKRPAPWDTPPEHMGRWAAEGAACVLRLCGTLEARFPARAAGEPAPAPGGAPAPPTLRDVFEGVEMPLLPVLRRMEAHGVRVDSSLLADLSREMGERIEALTQQVHELAGEPFNIGSPKQLADVLFEKLRIHEQLGLKRLKRTKTGYSTDASVLESLAEHPLAAKILEHRQLTKLKGTYVDALPALVHPASGRIHTVFQQAVAATGRLSSSDPNLQNIPIRTSEGRRIREAFVADPGHVLLSADYSQVELRIMAHLSDDEALGEAFTAGVDVHRRTAALVFGVPEAEVDGTLRNRAKAINFGILYGMGPQRLARDTGVSLKEAAAFIEQYFATFPRVKDWLDRTRAQALESGVVSTLAGRQRRLEGLLSDDQRLFAASMNMAVNTPIQGTAADIIKLAMIRVQAALDARGLTTRMLLQVHDELVFEVPAPEVETVRSLVVSTMEDRTLVPGVTLKVPLVVETGVGANWLQAH